MQSRFAERHDAGRQIAAHLQEYVSKPGVLGPAPPRGGVPVGYELARELRAPLDVFLVQSSWFP